MIAIRFPFAGLYESIHSHAIDDAVNSHACWLLKQTTAHKYTEITEISEFDGETPPDSIKTIVSDSIDYDAVKESVCKKFVDYFNKAMGINTFGIEIKFKGVWSPREYNVHTEQITCEISEPDFEKLFTLTNSTTAFEMVLKDELTSRPGFISFYSNDKQWWIDNFKTLTPDAKYCLGYLCLKAMALDIDGHSSTWEQGIWEDMAGNDEYGEAVAKACNHCQAAFKLGMWVNENFTTGEL